MTSFANGISVMKCFIWHAKQTLKLFERLVNAFMLNKNCDAAVSYLRCHVCPPAILRVIAFIVIDSVKRSASWRDSHILKEVLKNLPTIANGNTSAAIMRKASAVGVLAPLPHAAPYIVNFCFGFLVSKVMLLFDLATARVGSAVSKVCAIYYFCSATQAKALPSSASASSTTSFFYYLQQPIVVASKVYRLFSHAIMIHQKYRRYQFQPNCKAAQ